MNYDLACPMHCEVILCRTKWHPPCIMTRHAPCIVRSSCAEQNGILRTVGITMIPSADGMRPHLGFQPTVWEPLPYVNGEHNSSQRRCVVKCVNDCKVCWAPQRGVFKLLVLYTKQFRLWPLKKYLCSKYAADWVSLWRGLTRLLYLSSHGHMI